VKRKFLLTLQQGVSANQIAQMTEAGITQVVPKPFHKSFPKCSRSSLLTVHDFLALVQQNL
jgi:type II restriction enzyme